jgi:DNA-binding HxlR family transcriptional regulator
MGDRWKILIIRQLLTGTKRFGELKKSVEGISQKVLTQHLRQMETRGLLERKIYPQIPPRVEYTLTIAGRELKPILDKMHECGEKYQQRYSG